MLTLKGVGGTTVETLPIMQGYFPYLQTGGLSIEQSSLTNTIEDSVFVESAGLSVKQSSGVLIEPGGLSVKQFSSVFVEPVGGVDSWQV